MSRNQRVWRRLDLIFAIRALDRQATAAQRSAALAAAGIETLEGLELKRMEALQGILGAFQKELS